MALFHSISFTKHHFNIVSRIGVISTMRTDTIRMETRILINNHYQKYSRILFIFEFSN